MARAKNRGAEITADCTHYNVLCWNVGKYIRLSKEDIGKVGDDSNSIIHQRRLLDEYCSEHADEFSSVAEYPDEGVGG